MANRFIYLRIMLISCLFCLLFSSVKSDVTLQAAPAHQLLIIPNPILFVTQVPIVSDFTTLGSTFGNHLGQVNAVGRGGDLWIRYPMVPSETLQRQPAME
ncbi:MAG: hypothetical protein R2932_07955 [Caldilineaceae bacterium]